MPLCICTTLSLKPARSESTGGRRCRASRAAQMVEAGPKVDRFLTEMVGVSGESLLIKGFVGVGQVLGKVFRPQGHWLFENQFRDAVGLGQQGASGVV